MDKLIRLSVRTQLDLVQRAPRLGAYSDAEQEALLTEALDLLRDANVRETEIAEIRAHAWDRWILSDYVHHALGGSTIPEDNAVHGEWRRLIEFGANPTPDEVDDFLRRTGNFDGLHKDLAEGYRYYRDHRLHQRPEVWARRMDARGLKKRPPSGSTSSPTVAG